MNKPNLKPQHTPTPWKVNSLGYLVGQNNRYIRKQPANADFIVRAVNCHEELVETIKGLLTHPSFNKSKVNIFDLERIHQLIAKAEGR